MPVLRVGKAGRGRGRGWAGVAVLERWAAVDRERTRTPGTEEGSLLRRRPACLEGEQKGSSTSC